MERRFATDLRAAPGRRLEGRVATFGVETRIGGFTEVIRPGAFRESLAAGGDILALADHDKTRVLARTRSGTLRLQEDAEGLKFDLDVPDTQAGHDTLALAERGDLGGMSFGFQVREGGERFENGKRELLSVDLREISVVSAWPAYPETEVSARSKTPRLDHAKRFLETL